MAESHGWYTGAAGRSSAGPVPWAVPISSSMVAGFQERELQGKKVAAAELLKLWLRSCYGVYFAMLY